tara:strand:- start:298 stop:534 length:237 start_codon:yes stop_codon:yes gene_type:complete
MEVIITDQDRFLELNLTRIIKGFYPKLDRVQIDIIADEIQEHVNYSTLEITQKYIKSLIDEYARTKGIILDEYENEYW